MPVLEYDRQARPLGPGVLTIGSGPEAGWRVTGRDLAPIHALVTLERDGRAHLARPRSDVRIVVNGETLRESSCLIQPGDAIVLGDVTFHLRPTRHQEGAITTAFLRDMSRGRAWRILDRLEVGRDPGCQVHIPDPDVSRVHAELARDGDDVIVRSRGGLVFVNGVHVTADTRLREGDELGVGRTRLRFTRETPAAAAVVSIDAARRPSVGDSRLARARTSYMGVVQVREHLARERRKEWMKVARVVLIGVGLALGAAALASGTASVGMTRADSALRR